MVYATGKRDRQTMSTADYCIQKGRELRKVFLNTKKFDAGAKRNELKNLLRVNEPSVLSKIHRYPEIKGWKRFALETSDNKLIPVILWVPSTNSSGFTIVCDPAGKQNIPSALIAELIKSGAGIAVIDLSGTGETSSAFLNSNDNIGRLRTLFKSYLLLGKTPMGEWVKELNIVTGFIKSEYRSAGVSLYGIKEAGLAGLYLAALRKDIQNVTMKSAPLSYLFDNRESIEFFSSGVDVPGFLNWGDVSLAAALTGKKVRYISPVTISGRMINEEGLKEYNAEFERIRRRLGAQPETAKRKQ
jgi:hypothetical protein